ncbi:hypothetical protein F183_A35750 [Bryobacterales bacterium F-183]|nr:hypothetical protein F183_A35750 [Bryobacterales bacterium F-183]
MDYVIRHLACFLALAAMAQAELTPDQKEVQFRQMAGLYAKNYAPYEWKRDTQGFDLLETKGWIARARATATDLDFADLMIEYVAKLNDGHDVVSLRSDYYAYLGFDVDLYDGKPLIEYIDRFQLPRASFDFDIGDELISVDGVSVADMTAKYWKYSICANDRSTSRWASSYFTYRPQASIPRAHEIGDTAEVRIRKASTGTESTVTIAWDKVGTPMLSFGTIPESFSVHREAGRTFDGPSGSSADEERAKFRQLQDHRSPRATGRMKRLSLQGFGARSPRWTVPSGFTQRLGRQSLDQFYSGTYTSDGVRIGYIRIPSFVPLSTSLAVNQFASEVAYMQANTDGLVVDVTNNPGGYVDYTNSLLRGLMTERFQVIGFELRATSGWVNAFSQLLTESIDFGDPEWVVNFWKYELQNIQVANDQLRGRTGPIALDGGPDFEPSLDRPPLLSSTGAVVSYQKPIVLLVDEMTASGGDAFAATMQDTGRATLVGNRTMGLGGTVDYFTLDAYAELDLSITTGLMARNRNVDTNGEFPTGTVIENVGVRPEIANDYMTADNLTNGGRTYVANFTKVIVEKVRAQQQQGGQQ